MAKEGFSYYSSDTDRFSDTRIRRLKRSLGAMGYVVYEYALNEVYRDKGYYVPMDDELVLNIAEYWGIEESEVTDILTSCVEIGLFDKGMFENEHVLTSASIQERYIQAVKKLKRGRFNDIHIDDQYNLLRTDENAKRTDEIQKRTDETAKRPDAIKEKGHKRNNNIRKERIIEGTDVPTSDKPDAGLPSPDTNSDDESESVDEEKTGKEKAVKESINWANLVTNWNKITAGSFPPITSIENKRRQMAAARISEYGKDAFMQAIRRAVQSDFLRGQNARGFILNFDWLIRPNNFPKVLEGNYDNTTTRSPQTPNNNGTVTATKQRNPKFADFSETLAAIDAGINAGITERGISPVGK